jgi:hypothetical protein
MAYDASPVKGRQTIKTRPYTMPTWKETRKPPFTAAVRSTIRKHSNHSKTPNRVVTLRPKHGYLATKYDASAVKSQKILRRQFGRSYDQKKVRNNS